MARLGAHTFIWAAEWTTESARSILREASAIGLDVIEIPLLRPREIDVEATLKLCTEHNMSVTCSLGLPEHANLSEHPQEGEAFLMDALEVAKALNSPCLTGVTYATIGKLSGYGPKNSEYATMAKVLKRVARHAQTLGLEIGLEPCNRYETHLLNTGEQTIALLERIAEDNVFIHFDTYHMNIEEKGFSNALRQAGGYCRYIHLSESDRGVPGTGTVDWDDVFAGLRDSNFQGDMVVEAFMVIHPDIARALAVWRPVAPSVEVMVDEGLSFIRSKASQYKLLD